MSLVAPRKRKDTHNPRWASREKGKIRIVEHSAEGLVNGTTVKTGPRAGTSTGRTFINLRKGSIKLLSVFRNGKGRPPTSSPRYKLLPYTQVPLQTVR